MLKLVLFYFSSMCLASIPIVDKGKEVLKAAKKVDVSDLMGLVNLSPVALFTTKDCKICAQIKTMFKERKIDYKTFELSTIHWPNTGIV